MPNDKNEQPEIASFVEGKGVYIGDWTLEHKINSDNRRYITEKSIKKSINRGEIPLGAHFALYAAAGDLTGDEGKKVHARLDTLARGVSEIKGLHGHDGSPYSHYDIELYDAMRAGTYGGGWVMPSIEMLWRLYELKDKGALAGTFNTQALPWNTEMGKTEFHWAYLSSTREGYDVRNVFFSWDELHKNTGYYEAHGLARPVRLEFLDYGVR